MLCPAKINLGLHIFGKRPEDGRHNLATIFVPIDFGDEMQISPAPRHELITHNELPPHCRADFEAVSERGNKEGNLLWQVLERAAYGGGPAGVRIELTKRIPTGAGLGGGSSNAAALLAYLARTGALGHPEARNLARELGSDIAFFLEEGPSLAFGTGDLLENIALGPGCGCLALPPLHSGTAAAYAALKRPLQAGAAPRLWPSLDETVRAALASSRWDQVQSLTNDFESVVFEREPLLARIKDAFLEMGASYASLSGSGSALFALAPSRADAQRIAAGMRELFSECSFVPFAFLGKSASGDRKSNDAW